MVICALSCSPSMTENQKIANRHGFITFPQFLDNNFILNGVPDLKYLDKWLRRYAMGFISFAVSPDNMRDEALELMEKWPDLNWIWPLHDIDDDLASFEWVGFPHDEPRRNYDMEEFIKVTENKRRWYLGYHEGMNKRYLHQFDGLDTTIPSFYASKFKIWTGWGKSEAVPQILMNYHELIEFNTISLKIALRKLFMNATTQKRMIEF